jgi:acyl-CoA thioesterase FadM
VTLEKLGAATMLLQQDMQRHSDGKRIARATLKVACLDAREFTPVRIPEKIRMEIQHGT